jgi:hypothetical protein
VRERRRSFSEHSIKLSKCSRRIVVCAKIRCWPRNSSSPKHNSVSSYSFLIYLYNRKIVGGYRG